MDCSCDAGSEVATFALRTAAACKALASCLRALAFRQAALPTAGRRSVLEASSILRAAEVSGPEPEWKAIEERVAAELLSLLEEQAGMSFAHNLIQVSCHLQCESWCIEWRVQYTLECILK